MMVPTAAILAEAAHGFAAREHHRVRHLKRVSTKKLKLELTALEEVMALRNCMQLELSERVFATKGTLFQLGEHGSGLQFSDKGLEDLYRKCEQLTEECQDRQGELAARMRAYQSRLQKARIRYPVEGPTDFMWMYARR